MENNKQNKESMENFLKLVKNHKSTFITDIIEKQQKIDLYVKSRILTYWVITSGISEEVLSKYLDDELCERSISYVTALDCAIEECEEVIRINFEMDDDSTINPKFNLAFYINVLNTLKEKRNQFQPKSN